MNAIGYFRITVLHKMLIKKTKSNRSMNLTEGCLSRKIKIISVFKMKINFTNKTLLNLEVPKKAGLSVIRRKCSLQINGRYANLAINIRETH